jgi:hypothetical protein
VKLAGSVSVIVRVPVPCVNGVGDWNRTRKTQLAPCAKLVVPFAGHVVLSTWKLTPFVTLLTVAVKGPATAPGPPFVTVTFCVGVKPLPNSIVKVRLAGETPTLVPVPLSATTRSVAASGLASLVLMVMVVTGAAPRAVGWNLT